MDDVTTSKIMTIPKLGKAPPSRVLLWRWGANPTARGTFWLTRESVKQIINNFNARGNPLVFDVDHKSLDNNADISQKIAVGCSASLSTDSDGLWADNMVWTDFGSKLISDGGYLFDSPVIINSAQNVITALIAGSITNRPAKNNAQPLLFSTGDETMIDEELIYKVKPLRELQFALGAMLNSLQKSMEFFIDGEMENLQKSMGSQIPDWSMALSKFIDTIDPDGKTLPSDVESEKEEEKTELEPKEKNKFTDDDMAVAKASILALHDNNKNLEEMVESLKKETEILKKKSKIDQGIIEHKIPMVEKEKFMSFSDVEIDAYLKFKKPIINTFTDINHSSEKLKTEEDLEKEAIERSALKIFEQIRR